MSLKLNFELMAQYNLRMNKSVYAATAELSAGELGKDRGAFFGLASGSITSGSITSGSITSGSITSGSIIATLNHILVGDIIWLKRFAGPEEGFSLLDCPSPGFTSLEGVRAMEEPAALNAILYAELSLLAEARARLDEVIIQFVAELTDEAIASSLAYNNTKGQPFVKKFAYLLQHFFNHQTHHRGQVSTLLYQAGVDVGVTDLLIDIPNQ